jgi:hypothetical protein
MEKIVISSNVRKALDELVDILYYKEYFSYKKSAQDYVNNLYDFILTIPTLRYKTTLNKKYGAFYCCYKHNAKTSCINILQLLKVLFLPTKIFKLIFHYELSTSNKIF